MLRHIARVIVLYVSVASIPLALFLASEAAARVLSIEIERREPLLDGQPFGDRGPYELVEGSVRFGFEAANEANARVTDIGLAPRGKSGLVEASGDFLVLQPIDRKERSGTALVCVPNRGRRLELMGLNRAAYRFGEPVPLDPRSEADLGDGFLMELGLTVIWVGWQADVPETPGLMGLRVPRARQADGSPVRGLARSDWVVDRASERLELAARGHEPQLLADPESAENVLTRRRGRETQREVLPRSLWSFSEDRRAIVPAGPPGAGSRFEPGWIYELVYVAEGPPLVGLGFAAFRDFISFARHDPRTPFPIERAIADGSSQSGRFLRHLLYDGFLRDEEGRSVFDGMIIRIAGSGRGGFNHRFSHPGRVGNPYENFFYPGDLFPFASRPTRDGERREGLLDRARSTEQPPRLFQVNTGYEYWGRVASLVHTTPEAEADVAPLANERLYHIASAPHASVPFPPAPKNEVDPGLFRGSSVDTTGIGRALLRHMQRWVEEDTPPPSSRIPTLASGQLVEPGALAYPIASLATPRSPHVAYRVDYGPRWPQGIIDLQPPRRGSAFAVRVPAVDGLGNERGGIRPLEVRVPIGTYTPWALRTGFATSSDEMVGYLGSFLPLARTDADRREGDRRPSFGSLYPRREVYEEQVTREIDAMVEAGWLLPRDRVHAFRGAMRRWAWLMTGETMRPASGTTLNADDIIGR